jgi:hypothetical protein
MRVYAICSAGREREHPPRALGANSTDRGVTLLHASVLKTLKKATIHNTNILSASLSTNNSTASSHSILLETYRYGTWEISKWGLLFLGVRVIDKRDRGIYASAYINH